MIKKFFGKAINFFQENPEESLGIFFDGEKIFLAHSAEETRTLEKNFSPDLTEKTSPIEQLAQRVAFICLQEGWRTSQAGIFLNETETVISQTRLEHIPKEEVDAAVRAWAVAHAGEGALHTFAELDGKFFTAALPQETAEEYLSAFAKNSVMVAALTTMPENFFPNAQPTDKAIFSAEVAAKKNPTNFLVSHLSTWNLKKIFLFAATIFLVIIGILSAKLFYDYHTTSKNFSELQKNFSVQDNLIESQIKLSTNSAEMKELSELIAEQEISGSKLDALIKIGQAADRKIWLKRLRLSDGTAELEGTAENAEAVGKYLRTLRNLFAGSVRLENSSSAEADEVNFLIHLTFEEVSSTP